MSWINNLFEGVNINLEPTYYFYDQTNTMYQNLEMPFQARNNLLTGGRLRLRSMPTQVGNWNWMDNLFDRVRIKQYSQLGLPLDHDFNGYWPCTDSELAPGEAARLTAINSDGGTDAVHDVLLSATPEYQGGPFGHFYLSPTTLLHQAGSRTAGEAGLAQYTTSTNQAKENASLPVSIGLHYVAAASGTPLDSDGDGVPDYVEDANGNGAVDENETSPLLAQTVSGIYDATNAVYDDIDLSGNGLVGRIKKAFGLDALEAGNPLTLTQVITDDEPQFVTFEVPLPYDTLTNAGSLQLDMNGVEATLQSCYPATNGHCLLSWNTAYDPFGLHYLQVRFRLTGSEYGASVLSGVGSIAPFDSTNVLRFFEGDSLFGDTGAYLDAKLAVPNATYAIELYDPSTAPATLIKTITNSTANGLIREDWDLTCQDGTNVFAGDEVDAVFNVTLRAAGTGTPLATGKPAKRLTKLTTTEQGNGFDVVYMYSPTNSGLANSYSYGAVAWGMQGVVDVLMQPSWPWDPYVSSFNLYSWSGSLGLPGYVTSRAAITNYLFPSMADSITKNFYCFAHGTSNSLAGGGDACIRSWEVADLLGNHYLAPDPRKPGQGGLSVSNPYRFVFLDGCSTASANNWRRAFGIMPIWADDQSRKYGLGEQAYVGWATKVTDWMGGYVATNGNMDVERSVAAASAYTATLQRFYLDWMNGASLYQCINDTSDTNVVACPLPVPSVTRITVGQPFTSSPFTWTNRWPSKIYVVGHSGLTRSGLLRDDDGKYPPPSNDY